MYPDLYCCNVPLSLIFSKVPHCRLPFHEVPGGAGVRAVSPGRGEQHDADPPGAGPLRAAELDALAPGPPAQP